MGSAGSDGGEDGFDGGGGDLLDEGEQVHRAVDGGEELLDEDREALVFREELIETIAETIGLFAFRVA